MDFNVYQKSALATAIYPGRKEIGGLLYTALGLSNEGGEVAGKVKKILRDDNGELTPEKRKDIAKEIGDVLWYCATLADEIDCNLGTIAAQNLGKLSDRAERGVLGGSGDER